MCSIWIPRRTTLTSHFWATRRMFVRWTSQRAVQSFLGPGIGMNQPCFTYPASDSFLCRTAKVWKDFTLAYELKGHEQSVWAVLAVDEEQFITGAWRSVLSDGSRCSPIHRFCRQNDQTLAAAQSTGHVHRPSGCCTRVGARS